MTVSELLLPQRLRGPCKSEKKLCGKWGVGEEMRGFSVNAVTQLVQQSEHLLEETKGFSPPLSWRRARHFKDLSLTEETIICNGLHILSVVFKKEALLVSKPFSGSTETSFCLSKLVLSSKLVLFSLLPHLHQCTLALTLSQPLEGDFFPHKKGEQEQFQRM